MPRKRKSAAPQRADDSKRQQMTWNMFDLGNQSLTVVANNDPSLIAELENSARETLSGASLPRSAVQDLSRREQSARSEIFVKQLIDECDYYLSIYNRVRTKSSEWHCHLATFSLSLSPLFPEQEAWMVQTLSTKVPEFWLYVNTETHLHLLYFEIEEEVGHEKSDEDDANNRTKIMYLRATTDVPLPVLESLQHKCNFCLTLASYDAGKRQISLAIHALQGALTKLKFSSDGARAKKVNTSLQNLMNFFYGLAPIENGSGKMTKKHDIEELFAEIKRRHQQDPLCLGVNVQHPSLKPRLREYQRRGVQWMLSREGLGQHDIENKEKLHPLYSMVTMADGKTLYYCKDGGYLVEDFPRYQASPPGGILADEMGLGKTVEVLSCMLSNPRLDLPSVDPLPVAEVEEEETQTSDDVEATPNSPSCSQGQKTEDEEDITSRPPNGFNGKCEKNKLEMLEDEQAETCNDMEEKTETNIVHDVNHVEEIISNGTSKSKDEGKSSDKPCIESQLEMETTIGQELIAGTNEAEGTKEEDCPQSMSQACPLLAMLFEKCMKEEDHTEEKGSEADTEGCKAIQGEHNYAYNIADVCKSETEKEEVAKVNGIMEICPEDGGMPNDDKEVSTQPPVEIFESQPPSEHEEQPDEDVQIMSSSKVDNSMETENKFEVIDISQEEEEIIAAVDSDIIDITPTKAKSKKKQPRNSTGSRRKKKVSEKNSGDNAQEERFHPQCQKRTPSSTTKRKPHVELVEINETSEADNYWQRTVAPKVCFECVCGKRGEEEMGPDGGLRVQCEGCGTWQHPNCVHYNLTDPYRGRYLCPHCHVACPPIESGATLIISPNSICHQWEEEISKHIHQQSLKVHVYTGVNKQGFLQPRTLANMDIVITTYETLRKEIDYVDLPHTNSEAGRRFRHPKRFMAIPSPIIAVQWWRICLDEAQMVECTTTKTAEMALRLSAVNRWCVTGTPIQRGIDDLYGLLLFLGVDPYWVHHWWNTLLYMPYCHGNKEPLHSAVSQLLWRTAKKDVLDQICLPNQTEEMHWLTFTPVEEHFYRRQYQNCAREALKNLSKWTDANTRLNTLDRYTLHQLLHPLLRLRQACCHPQVVKGEFLPIHKSTLTMEELLDQLTKKTRVEGEEAHRQYVAAVSGLAALHIIEDQLPEAVERYREALRSIEEHREGVRTDELQQLHILHNLREVLEQKPPGVAPTLRDDQLAKQAEEIREKYLAKAAAYVTQTQDAWSPLHKSLTDLQAQWGGEEEWWAELLQWVMYQGLDLLMVEKVKEELSESRTTQVQSLANSFRDVRGLEYVLMGHLEQLDKAHDRLVTALRALSCPPSRPLINETVECCLRPADEGNPLKTCPFCKADELFEEYESKLFSFVDKGVSEAVGSEEHRFLVSTRRQGTWADSELEKTLKVLISFAKGYQGVRQLVEFGNLHIKIFDALKKEFRALRSVWMALREQVSAFDELDMATMRFRLRLPEEPRTDPPQTNVIDRCELGQQRMKLLSDRIIGQNDLRRKLGQLLYLKNLAKTQSTLEGGENPEPCPVCQAQLGTKWSVLQCGHCYCLECIRILVDKYSVPGHGRSMKCPVCRQRTAHSNISYVSTRSTREEDQLKVKGDHSTKIAGIVRCLMKITEEDPTAKALVFSTWQDVLDVLSQAFRDNNISYKSLLAHNKFQDNLTAFKQQENLRVLLLPVHSGANGLNLIEATHVLLVEPILNPAQELQAIGRVHRIGQTKPTVVHRFLVKGTIEERMNTLLQSNHTPTVNSHNAEETPLTIGDLSSLFKEIPEDTEMGEEQEEVEGGQGGQESQEGQEAQASQGLGHPTEQAGPSGYNGPAVINECSTGTGTENSDEAQPSVEPEATCSNTASCSEIASINMASGNDDNPQAEQQTSSITPSEIDQAEPIISERVTPEDRVINADPCNVTEITETSTPVDTDLEGVD